MWNCSRSKKRYLPLARAVGSESRALKLLEVLLVEEFGIGLLRRIDRWVKERSCLHSRNFDLNRRACVVESFQLLERMITSSGGVSQETRHVESEIPKAGDKL